MLTGADNEKIAVRTVKAGVYDYLRKETLDKDHLRNAILESYDKHKIELKKLNELTNQSHAFNKAIFYQELEQNEHDEENTDQVLLIIELNNHKILEERLDVILRDGIICGTVKQSFEVFNLGECNPSITRFSDASHRLHY